MRNATPALFIFGGAVVALVWGVVRPPELFSTGAMILLGSAVLGFVVRLLMPPDSARTSAGKGRGSYDLVIFDCDGVLVDSEVLVVEVEARVLTELGWPMEAPEVVRRWVGRSSATQLAEIAERLGPEAAETFDARTTSESRKALERSLTPVDGVRALLDHLDGIELPYCVASSSSHERLRLVLGITGLMGRFAGHLYSSEDVADGKPSPALFLHAARESGANPARCVVVEDSVYGVHAAVEAGMTVFGFAGGLTGSRELAAAGATVFHDMSDLVGLLGRAPTRP